jgi:polyisoprenoid-binding protein YceI
MSATKDTQQTTTYAIDNAHSNVEFIVRHMMISKVRGRFGTVSGTIAVTPDNLPASIDVNIDAASVDTREPQRDAHLRSADFFDVEQYPQLQFLSTRVEGSPEDFKVHGDLTIHGVTRPVVLEGSFEGRGTDPWGNERVAYAATTKINRKDYLLNWNQALETGGVIVSDEVRIELNVEATLAR